MWSPSLQLQIHVITNLSSHVAMLHISKDIMLQIQLPLKVDLEILPGLFYFLWLTAVLAAGAPSPPAPFAGTSVSSSTPSLIPLFSQPHPASINIAFKMFQLIYLI